MLTLKESVVKAVTYRLLVTLFTFGALFYVLEEGPLSMLLALADLFLRTAVYVAHERVFFKLLPLWKGMVVPLPPLPGPPEGELKFFPELGVLLVWTDGEWSRILPPDDELDSPDESSCPGQEDPITFTSVENLDRVLFNSFLEYPRKSFIHKLMVKRLNSRSQGNSCKRRLPNSLRSVPPCWWRDRV